MLESLHCIYSLCGVELEHALNEINALRADRFNKNIRTKKIICLKFREVGLKILQILESRPILFCRCPSKLENLEELVDLAPIANKNGSFYVKLKKSS